jgi:hypothetical protein
MHRVVLKPGTGTESVLNAEESGASGASGMTIAFLRYLEGSRSDRSKQTNQ